MRESVFLALDAAPEKFDVENIEQAILSHPNVLRIHDLHVWALSTSQNALSVHVVSDLNTPDQLLEELNKIIKKQFNISHNTIQIEKSTAHLHCDCSHESITSHDHAH